MDQIGGETLKNNSGGKKAGIKKVEDEKVLDTIEDLRTEVKELRGMVNLLVEMIVSIEAPEEMDGDLESNMMSYDPLLKNGKYCM